MPHPRQPATVRPPATIIAPAPLVSQPGTRRFTPIHSGIAPCVPADMQPLAHP